MGARATVINDRAKALGHGADRLADYIAGCLAARGPETQRIGAKGDPVTVTLAKQSLAKPKVVDAGLLPAEHLTAILEMPALDVPASWAWAVVERKPQAGLLDSLANVDELPPGVERVTPTRAVRFR